MRTLISRSLLPTAVLAALALAPMRSGAAAATYALLHGFQGNGGSFPDGAQPEGDLLRGPDGALYGTTVYGGETSNCGIVYKLTPHRGSWRYAVLHRFAYKAGCHPDTGLIMGADGVLYGTITYGGTCNNAFGCGVVFKLTPPAPGQRNWHATVLHDFLGPTEDGTNPQAGLLLHHGALYGVTTSGGVSNLGTVFKLTPVPGKTQWQETVLHSFAGGSDSGAYPIIMGGLIAGPDGALYGTTSGGGPSNMGTVFKLTPQDRRQKVWTETVLHRFPDGDGDGANPYAGLTRGPDGVLYGTTLHGGPANAGTIFKLTPPPEGQSDWTEELLHSFSGGSDGAFPYAGLNLRPNGVLYGTTHDGGDVGGTIFKLKPPAEGQTQWSKTVLQNFDGRNDGHQDSYAPLGGMALGPNGRLYGTVTAGGCDACAGAVFEFVP